MGNQMKRILLATPLFPPDIGGPATYAKLLCDELPKRGMAVDVVSFGSVRILPVGLRHTLFFLMLVMRAGRSDVLYALDPSSVGFPAALAAFLFDKPLVLKIVGDYAWEQYEVTHPDSFVDPLLFKGKEQTGMTKLRHTVQCWVARRARAIIVPSGYLKRIVTRWGVAESKITVIPNAYEVSSNIGNKDALRALLGFSGTLIVSAGRLVPWKGFAALIDAMPEVLRHAPDAKLVIVGDGPERSALEQKIKEQKLDERVVLTGTLAQDVLHSYIRAADLFVLNTGYEGFSHLLLEVMTLETPIVTTNAGGNPELLSDRKEGMLVPFNDTEALVRAMVAVLGDPLLSQGLTRNAERRVAAFDKEHMLEATERIFRACVKK